MQKYQINMSLAWTVEVANLQEANALALLLIPASATYSSIAVTEPREEDM